MRIFTCPTCGETGHFAKSCPKDPARDLTGKTFGRWAVIGLAERTKHGWRWLVECSCPAKTRKTVADDTLRKGESQSCGCAPREAAPPVCGNCGERGHYITTCPAPKCVVEEKRRCPACEQDKALNEFSPNNAKCRPCQSAYGKRWRAAKTAKTATCDCGSTDFALGRNHCKKCDAARQVEYRAEKRADGHDVDRRSHLRSTYDVDPATYASLLAAQHGQCAICGTTNPAGRTGSDRFKHFAVDHEHDTGRVRGLLCLHCNRGIGMFDDDPARLDTAAIYIDTAHTGIYLRGAKHNWSNRAAKPRITDVQYNGLTASQAGRCAICCERETLEVDHDHSTNEVRGALCHNCNLGLGLLRDSTTIRAAITYIHKTPEGQR